MSGLAARGNSVTVFASDSNHLSPTPKIPGRHLHQDIDGVQVYWLRTFKYPTARSLKRILSWIHFDFGIITFKRSRLPRPEVIIASSLSLTSVLVGILLSWRHKARLIFEVRDIWPLTLTEEGGYSSRNPMIVVLALIERIGYRAADAIVGTMPNLEQHVRSVSTTSAPVYCVPMGYSPDRVDHVSAPSEYLEAGVPEDRFVIGYAGTIGRTNALETFFQAAKSLEADDRIHFVLVGRGDLLDDYKVRYGGLCNMTFVGPVPRASVQAVLARFDALYLSTSPSNVWKYGQSLNKLIDYMLAAKPVVASYDGYQSMINEARSGVFVSPEDLDGLIETFRHLSRSDSRELVRMGDAGRAWVLEHRNYLTLAERYEKIVASVLSDVI